MSRTGGTLTRRRLLFEAIRQFGQNGYENTSLPWSSW